MISKKTTLTTLLIGITSLNAFIKEIHHFSEIFEYNQLENALFLIDIDNTVLEPSATEQTASDQWFTTLLKQYEHPHDAISHYCTKVLETPMQLVESAIPEIIKKIQNEHMVLGFTMRSLVLAPCTTDYCMAYGIDFNQNIPDRGFMIDEQCPVLMYHGTLFCQGHKNSSTLFTVLDAYQIYPKTIIMIDDKKKYLSIIEDGCTKRGIIFIGLRYSYLDQKVEDFLQNTFR